MFQEAFPDGQGSRRLDPLSGTLAVAHVTNPASDSRYKIGKRSLLSKDSELLRADLSQVVVGVGGGRQHHQESGNTDIERRPEEEKYEDTEPGNKRGQTPANIAQEVNLKGG